MLKRYISEIEQDLVVTDFNIKEVQLRLPSRKHFWVSRLIDAKVTRDKLQKRKKILKKDLVDKIINKSPVKITAQTADAAAERSDEIVEINDSIKEYDYIVEYLEKVEKILSTMHWEIKNIIQLNESERL